MNQLFVNAPTDRSSQFYLRRTDHLHGEMRCEKVRKRAATSESQTVYSACSGLLSYSLLLSGRQITRIRQRWLTSSVRSMYRLIEAKRIGVL
jgi:hypothetical protein